MDIGDEFELHLTMRVVNDRDSDGDVYCRVVTVPLDTADDVEAFLNAP